MLGMSVRPRVLNPGATARTASKVQSPLTLFALAAWYSVIVETPLLVVDAGTGLKYVALPACSMNRRDNTQVFVDVVAKRSFVPTGLSPVPTVHVTPASAREDGTVRS